MVESPSLRLVVCLLPLRVLRVCFLVISFGDPVMK